MSLFDFMQKGWFKGGKREEREKMLIPLDREDVPLQERQETEGGNGDLVDRRLVTLREPYSIAAEQYRVLCTRIFQLTQNKPSYTLAITSSVKNEGKTFTSLNLAISMAKDFDEKVLLIEGDLKRPNLHELLKRPPGFGITDLLERRIDFKTALVSLFDGKLSVLLAGKTIGNPSRYLTSPGMQELLNSCRGDFKYIIIDTPPIVPLADINIYSTLVDGILVVIKAGKTPRSVVKKALSTIPGEKLIGAVLNEVDPNQSRYYYGGKYSY